MLGEQAGDDPREAGRLEVARGDVDGDRPRLAQRRPPRLVGECPAQHPSGEQFDHARLLRRRQELGRREQATLRMLPADQRLQPVDLVVAEADLGLVVQHQFVAFDRAAQLGLHGQPVGRVGDAVLGVEHDVGGAALALVHRGVRALEQLLDLGAVPRVERDAEAGLDAQRHAVEDGLADQFGAGGLDQVEHGVLGQPGYDQAELVAAEAGHGVAPAQRLREPGSDQPQQLVAGVVAQGVVDLLEAVQVDEHDRALGARDRGAVDRALRPRLEGRPVGQSGEAVVQRLVLLVRGVAAQRAGGVPGDQREHQVEGAEGDAEPPVRDGHLAAQLGVDGVVRQVELEDADRLAGRARDHRLEHPDGPADAAIAVRDHGHVGGAGRGRPERGVGDEDAAGRRAVVGEHHLAGEAADPQPDDRAVEDREVRRAL
nr:hypothetical protein GCM10020092_062150 [Actinoplanes digitatis]